MSRLGKKGITMTGAAEAQFSAGTLSVKGPKGTLTRDFRPEIKISISENLISLVPVRETNENRALWGTYASHIKNMVKGVTEGFEKKLILEGVGYKSEVAGNKLVLALGFSHKVEIIIPEGLVVKAEKNVLTFSGMDKELVGQFAAKIRSLKKPEPYKGKGFRYSDEVIRRKQGKKSV